MYKENYRNTFNRCIFIDKDQNISNDFVSLARSQNILTFDRRYLDPQFRETIQTPFKEIERYDNFIDFHERERSYDYILNEILDTYKSILRRINPNEKYLFACSSGSDSRIIAALLAQLRDEEGYNFDNVLFHCWGKAEKDSFLELMRRCHWKNISILDDSVSDPYDAGVPDISVDGWYSYNLQLKFWGTINPKDYILLSGAEGETLLRTFDQWKHSHGYFSNRGESVHKLANIFKDIFFPYLQKEMLSITMSIPSHIKNVHDNRMGRDKIRTDLCKMLGVHDIPIQNFYYNFNFSNDRKKLMLDLYHKSKFKKEFNIKINSDELFKSPHNFSAKVWGFAVTIYENLF